MGFQRVCLFLGYLWFFGLGVWACSQGEPCSPGATRPCTCVAVSPLPSVQVCKTDGHSWGECNCSANPQEHVADTATSEPQQDGSSTSQQEPSKESEPSASLESTEPDGGEVFIGQDDGTADHSGSDDTQGVESNTDDVVDQPDTSPSQRLRLDVWPWGADAAISLTIDDGLASPFVNLIPEIEKRGWRSTLFITTEFATTNNTWPQIQKAYQAGHDIGAHTHTHRNLTKLTETQIHEEFTKAIYELQSRLDWKIPLQSFAYPYEASNAAVESIVQQYHRYARGGDQGVPVPPNPIPLNDAHQPNFPFLQAKAPTRNYTISQWNTWVDEAVKQKKWLIEEYHGVDEQDWEPRTMNEYRAHFNHIESYGRRVWVAPVTRVGHFIDERQTASFAVVQWSDQEILLTLSNRFGTTHRELLTYSIQIPTTWKWNDIKVIQDGKVQRHERLGPSLFRAESMPDQNLNIRIIPQ